MKFQSFVSLIGVMLLGACASTPDLAPGPHIQLVDSAELPPPSDVDLATGDRPYRVGAFDEIRVSVFGVPELTQTVQVDASGRIALPLVGTVEAAQKTPDELSSAIADRLRGQYVRDPQVAVNVTETVSQSITVDGQVEEPGQYPVLGRMTLMRAVASAKGATEFARLQDVVVFRNVGGQEMVALYNLAAIRRGHYRDPEVYANDVIVVGDSPSRRLFRDLLQSSSILMGPIIALLQR